jgi:uracil-DNA glycosylase
MTKLHYLAPAFEHALPEWRQELDSAALAPHFELIDSQLTARAAAGEVIYPPREQVFRALSYFTPAETKVVILGQDPYHGDGEAMGLSFSVPPGVRIPPSLRNIYKELNSDLGLPIPTHGDLTAWAEEKVLLLNSVLTVQADTAGAHGKLGWEKITDALIDRVNRDNPGCVFILWGNWAQTKAARIDSGKHLILKSAHPSPLSARRGFFGSRPFSQANAWLEQHGRGAVDWRIQAQA